MADTDLECVWRGRCGPYVEKLMFGRKPKITPTPGASPIEQCIAMMVRVLDRYREQGACSCAFPRFRQVAAFHFRPYAVAPVGCHISQVAIAQLTREGGPLVKIADRECPSHRCAVCGTTATISWEQYSINMDVTLLEYADVKAPQRGAEPLPRIPMPQGFFGLGGNANIQAVAAAISTAASFEELEAYLLELSPAAYFMNPSTPTA